MTFLPNSLQVVFQGLWKTNNYVIDKIYTHMMYPEKSILLLGSFKFINGGHLVGNGNIIYGSGDTQIVIQCDVEIATFKIGKIIWPWGYCDMTLAILELETGVKYPIRVTMCDFPSFTFRTGDDGYITIARQSDKFLIARTLTNSTYTFIPARGKKFSYCGLVFPAMTCSGAFINTEKHILVKANDMEHYFTLSNGNLVIVPTAYVTTENIPNIIRRILQLNSNESETTDVQLDKLITMPENFARPPIPKQFFLTFSVKPPIVPPPTNEKRPAETENSNDAKKVKHNAIQDEETELDK
jgi:hypothetical protein